MANDPNRDLLPVKDIDERSSRGTNCKVDHNVIGKLKRCDLEDRYMRLYDENTEIKKQLNVQDEKIKRLGTKLLRLTGDKKCCSDNCGKKQGLDELQMRVIELEHENYTLKDRNVVLKQQLANHARHHVAAHRSPNRSVHTSPRVSQRQCSAPNVNDANCFLSTRNPTNDVQLREAEEHIHGLNEEIKSLHNKIDTLQQDLEKNSLESQRTKVSENIELIRLQRSLKQQSIQIASLQAHIKSSEKSQKLLRDELASAHKENEESLEVISEKQKEILDLYSKLEEKNVCRLEQEELRERINDLTAERDSLRERAEFLMKAIEAKSSEVDIINDLKKLLATEKAKKEELKTSLENTQKLLQALKDSARLSQASDEALTKMPSVDEFTRDKVDRRMNSVGVQTEPDFPRHLLNCRVQDKELYLLASTQLISPADDRRQPDLSVRKAKCCCMPSSDTRDTRKCISVGTSTGHSVTITVTKDAEIQAPEGDILGVSFENEKSADMKKVCQAEKMNLERELDYVKQILRSQTQRCEAQEEEINRLKSDLNVSQEKYNDTVRRLDLHLKIFRHLESRTARVSNENDPDPVEQKYLALLASFEDGALDGVEKETIGKKTVDVEDKKNDYKVNLRRGTGASVISSLPEKSDSQTDKNSRAKFRRQVFLDSSDEEDLDDNFRNIKVSALRSERSAISETFSMPSTRRSGSSDSGSSKLKKQEAENRPVPKPRMERPKGVVEIVESQITAESNFKEKRMSLGGSVSISIEWLKLDPETSVWNDDSVKLLFVDFNFLDVKGEEAETPSSLKKPRKPGDKCLYNFTKDIELNPNRLIALQSLDPRSKDDIIVFKVVSEPEESSTDGECVDIGIASVTIEQFFNCNSSVPLLLQVKNCNNLKESIGTLCIRLDVASIK